MSKFIYFIIQGLTNKLNGDRITFKQKEEQTQQRKFG